MKFLEPEIESELRRINLSRNRYAYVLQFGLLIFSVWYQTRFQHPLNSFILALGASGCLFRIFATEVIPDDKKPSDVFLWLGFLILSAAWVFHIDQTLAIHGHHGATVPVLRVTIGGLILLNNALLVADLISYYVFLIPITIGLIVEVFWLNLFHHPYPLASFLVLSSLSSFSLHYQHRQLRDFIGARLESIRERNRLKYLINNVPGYVAMVNADGMYFEANEQVCNIFPGIVGKRIGDFAPNARYTNSLLNFLHSRKDRESVETEIAVNGETYHLMTTFGRIENGGAISISIPMGELVETRRELRDTSKLATIGQMAAGVAHEVNNPLAIIQGSANIIAGLVDEEQIDRKNLKLFSEKIVTTSERIAQIVRSLRSLSRGEEQDPFAPLSLKNLITSCLDISNHNFELLDIKVTVQDGKKDFMVMGREVQLGQVLLNLLSNAIDATKCLSDRWVRFDYGHSDGQVWIEVVDSGKGIPPEISSRMMNAFFTTKGKEEGTGLGLSISTRIISEHGGKLTYESERENTTFRIIFPSPKI